MCEVPCGQVVGTAVGAAWSEEAEAVWAFCLRRKLLNGFSSPSVENAEHLSLNKLIRKFVTMRINQNTVLQGKRVTLVPYTLAHVPRYHEWMKSEELQHLTASEPLSLEQEYEMQCSWREDKDKCTFIILDTEKWSRQSATEEDCMVGDVNLFLTDSEDPTRGEIEVMIAEVSYRGRGFGKEATQIMMFYGMTQLGLTTFEAKIGLKNEASIGMFKKLHFKEVGVNSVFQEVTLGLSVDEQEREWLLEQTSHVEEKNYNVMKMQTQTCSS